MTMMSSVPIGPPNPTWATAPRVKELPRAQISILLFNKKQSTYKTKIRKILCKRNNQIIRLNPVNKKFVNKRNYKIPRLTLANIVA